MSSFSYSLPDKPTFGEFFDFVGKANSVAAERDAFMQTKDSVNIIGVISVVALGIFNLYAGIFAFFALSCTLIFFEHKVKEKKAKFQLFMDVYYRVVGLQGWKNDLIEVKCTDTIRYYANDEGHRKLIMIEKPVHYR